jgi:heat shock protein HslJ
MKHIFNTPVTLILLFALFSIVAAVAKGQPQGEKWILTAFGEQSVKGKQTYIEFDGERNALKGNSGCNKIFGRYLIENATFRFSGVRSTKMACADADLSRIESGFIRSHSEAAGIRRNDEVVNLHAHNAAILEFRVVRSRSFSELLGSRKWILSEVAGNAVSKDGETAFINFDPGKTSAGGNTSCNVFGGNYATDGTTIRFYDLISTMRACIEDDGMNIERQFMDGLQNANRFEISDGHLRLYKDDRSLLTLRGVEK